MDIAREFNSPQVWDDPYPFYARLRSMGPVIPMKKGIGPQALLSRGPVFLLPRHEEVYSAFRDPRFANDRAALEEGGARALNPWWVPRLFRIFQQMMIGKDGTDHRRLRDLVHKAFTPGMIEGLSGRVQQMVDRMLDEAGKKPTSDLIADMALPLPLTVISEMLGVPEKARMEFRKMMMPITETLANGALGFLLYAPTAFRLERFLRKLVKLRREEPGDDMVTALVRAEEAGDRLNEEELIAMVFLLLLAGHETTVNLIGNGTLALMEHPDQLQKLVEHPELIDSAIEELLRFASPVAQLVRFTREDVEIKGHEIPRGSTVILLMGSANRDEAAFENADQLDVARTPNRHVSFGYGVHYCLGAPLARLEGRIALLDLLRRFPEMRLAVPREKVRWRRSFGLRGMRTLPLHLGPAASKANARSAAQGAVHAVAGAP